MKDWEKKIKSMHKSGGKLYEGGTYGVGSIELADDGNAAVYFLERSIAYHRKGMSYYQGTNVFDGKTELVVKPVSLWRDGENQHNDKPYNQYFIVSFKNLKTETHDYELVLRDGEGMIEILKVNFRSRKVSSLEVMTGSEYMDQKQDKSTAEKISLIKTRIYEVLHEDNPKGFNGIEKVFILDFEKNKLTSLDQFGDDWAPHFDNPENKLMIVDTHECLYGNAFLERVFLADPATQQVGYIMVDRTVRRYFTTFNCLIKSGNLLIKIDVGDVTYYQKSFKLSDLESFFS